MLTRHSNVHDNLKQTQHAVVSIFLLWKALRTGLDYVLRAIVCNFQAFSTSRGHFISPIWLKFGM